jgi:hypothetical protein
MIRTVSLAFTILVLGACGHLPWGGRPAHAPESVNELLELAEDGTRTNAFPQYWVRNVLVIDMQGAASAGKLTLKPRPRRAWPMRLAFRVRPGTLGLLEVQAEQRMFIPVTREGTAPVDVALASGVYTPKTEQLSVQWGR